MECRICLSAQLSNSEKPSTCPKHREKRDYERGMKVGIIAVLADGGGGGGNPVPTAVKNFYTVNFPIYKF